jgi:S1-C subfamily serine protease
LEKGDIVKTLNGKEIKSIADFNKEFDATKIGAPLRLELLRDGKQVIVSAPRPEPKQMIMRRN